MRYSNEEMVSIAEDAIKSINIAISEIDDCEEYEEEKNWLEEIITNIKSKNEKYEEEYAKELREEEEYANSEYMRSVI